MTVFQLSAKGKVVLDHKKNRNYHLKLSDVQSYQDYLGTNRILESPSCILSDMVLPWRVLWTLAPGMLVLPVGTSSAA